MTLPWRTLEREIVELLREQGLHPSAQHGEAYLVVGPIDLPLSFNLSTFAKDLAKRLERT